MDILVCDKCGFQLDKREDIVLALDGSDAWQNSCRARDEEPRGLFPCKNYIQCKGQMLLVKESKKKKGLFGRNK
jgi:hypothetical protein